MLLGTVPEPGGGGGVATGPEDLASLAFEGDKIGAEKQEVLLENLLLVEGG